MKTTRLIGLRRWWFLLQKIQEVLVFAPLKTTTYLSFLIAFGGVYRRDFLYGASLFLPSTINKETIFQTWHKSQCQEFGSMFLRFCKFLKIQWSNFFSVMLALDLNRSFGLTTRKVGVPFLPGSLFSLLQTKRNHGLFLKGSHTRESRGARESSIAGESHYCHNPEFLLVRTLQSFTTNKSQTHFYQFLVGLKSI